MKNTVTFETAKRLKEAGFPQPEPEFGQFWYHNAGLQIAIMESNDAGGHIGKFIRFFGTVNGSLREKSFFSVSIMKIFMKDACFAPTATDILKEIPFVSLSFEVYETRFEFRVWEGLKLIAKHENPHEAAALAWLSIQEIQKK